MTDDAPLADVSSPAWTVVHGWVHPRAEEAVNLAALTARLRSTAIAAVSESAPAVGEAATIGLLVTDDEHERVALQTPEGPIPGVTLQELAEGLARDLDVSVSVGEVWADPSEPTTPEDEDAEEHPAQDAEFIEDGEPLEEAADEAVDEAAEEDEWVLEHPLVIVSRTPESMLPLLARSLDARLTATHDDGWTVALAERDFVFLEHHPWLRSELPAASLGRSGERRYVTVVAEPRQPVEYGLVRFDDLIPVLDPIGVPIDLVDGLLNPHLVPGSAVHQLCTSRPFFHLDPYELATVLQSPMDERWSSRVLATLGLPLSAAELAEERSVPGPEATTVEVQGIAGMIADSVRRYYDAPEHEVRNRTPYGRAYAEAVASPSRVAVTVAAESLAASAAWAAARSTSGWRRGMLRLLAGTLAADVATHAVLAPLKFRRR